MNISMNSSILTPTLIRLYIVGFVVALLGFGYYLQYVEGLEPCPLCITQRVFLASCALVALVALIHRPQKIGSIVYAVLGSLLAIAGGGFSSRQLYLQSLPEDKVPACGPSLEFMFETFPLMDAIGLLLRGDGNCAEVTWRFLGLSIPGWTLCAFVVIAAGFILQAVIKRSNHART